MQILYEDSAFAVLVKEPGEECEHQLPMQLVQTMGNEWYCVHRLDRAVGGLIVYARSRDAAAAISRQIADQRFKKEYLAVINGKLMPTAGQYQDLLWKDGRASRAYVVDRERAGVKSAALTYESQDQAEWEGTFLTLVHVCLQTGRFHQIRVQFASRGLPLLGDGKYGSRIKCPIALFSCRLQFVHPESDKAVSFTTLPPDAFPWNQFAALQEKRTGSKESNNV